MPVARRRPVLPAPGAALPAPGEAHVPRRRYTQLRLGAEGTPLSEAEMVVVDLETTGTDPSSDAITEIGAVRVRGGEILGEFQTFVDPERPIPAFIASLTGITDATVAGAPAIDAVLPMFLEFARGAALVAHNARFDIGFLRAAAAAQEIPWPDARVLDTLKLARAAFGRDEVRDYKLGTLAARVGATTTPDHRALSDARATVDVLHAIIARLGTNGASTVEDLASAHRKATAVQMRKRHLADTVPSAPGVYQFVDAAGAVLYVGTSGDLRSRVRTYFTAAETRRKVLDMLPRAVEVRTIVCATATEAAVRELRIIAKEQPPANRHGLRPEKASWLRLGPGGDGMRGARLARDESDGSAHIGPLRSGRDVEMLRGLLSDAVMGRAASFRQSSSDTTSAGHHELLRRAMVEDPSDVIDHAAARMRRLVETGRYEDAAAVRGRAEAFLTAAKRASRLRAISAAGILVAARPVPGPTGARAGWELLAVRSGRFLGTRIVRADADPVAAADQLVADSLAGAGELPDPAPLCQGHHQETEILLHWLAEDDVRVVRAEEPWAQPVRGRFDEAALQRAFARSAAR